MALSYSDLKQQILNYAQKESYDKTSESGDANFDLAIPFFVNIALEKIYRDIHVIEKNSVTLGTNTFSTQIFGKPANWIQTISFFIGPSDLSIAGNPQTPLFKRTSEFCKRFIGLEKGMPKFYADSEKDEFILAPAPDKQYYYKIIYETEPPYLNISNVDPGTLNESWVMQKYPSLIFYAAYIEALRYMGKGDEVPLYQGLYDEAVKSINMQNQFRNVDRTSNLEKV